MYLKSLTNDTELLLCCLMLQKIFLSSVIICILIEYFICQLIFLICYWYFCGHR